MARVKTHVARKTKVNLLSDVQDVIQSRYILTFLTFCGMSLIFGHRVCLNVALVAMVNGSAETELPKTVDQQTGDENHCPMPSNSQNDTESPLSKQGTLMWSPSIQGVILSSYFYGYVIAQVIGGQLAELIGAKRLFGGATCISSVLTLITPAICGWSPWWVITLRAVLGFVHGMNYPCAYTLFARWSPLQERGTLLSICVLGTHFGVVISMPITAFLCDHGWGWPSAYYLLGCLGVFWMIFWVFLVFESPEQHPRISNNELEYIQKNIPYVSKEKKNASVPWLEVMTSYSMWAVTLAKFCGGWSFICFQSKLPIYLDEVLHLPIQKNGFVNSLLFGAICVSLIISGKLSDFIITRKYLTTTKVRKLFETVALLGPAACMAAVPFTQCNSDAVIVLLTVAMALFGLYGGGDVPTIVDMAPDFAGKIFGVSNAISSMSGILSPIVAGYFLEGNKGDAEQWNVIFYLSIGMYLFGAIVFLAFGSAEVQPWGRQTDDRRESKIVVSVMFDPQVLKKKLEAEKDNAVSEWKYHYFNLV